MMHTHLCACDDQHRLQRHGPQTRNLYDCSGTLPISKDKKHGKIISKYDSYLRLRETAAICPVLDKTLVID